MGYRLYSAKTYKVEWDFIRSGYFNWLSEEINTLIFANCPTTYGNCEDRCFSDTLEVDRKEFTALIEKIRNDTDEVWTNFINSVSKDYSQDDMVEMLEDLLNHADPDNDFIVLHWA